MPAIRAHGALPHGFIALHPLRLPRDIAYRTRHSNPEREERTKAKDAAWIEYRALCNANHPVGAGHARDSRALRAPTRFYRSPPSSPLPRDIAYRTRHSHPERKERADFKDAAWIEYRALNNSNHSVGAGHARDSRARRANENGATILT